jgi:DNA-binding beta-propeller fold protein YncE
VKVIGKLGNKPGEFNLPNTIEQDSQGNFFVNERGNERVQKFDANWNPILSWGTKGSSDNQFCHMEHMALDKHDNVYVTDPQSDPGCSKHPRVLKFDSNGNFITKFGSYDVYVSDPYTHSDHSILPLHRIPDNVSYPTHIIAFLMSTELTWYCKRIATIIRERFH